MEFGELLREIRRFFSMTPLRDLLEKYRHLGLREADIFLVSYQNSGSTWLKNLIYEMVRKKKFSKESSYREFPFVGKHKDSIPLINSNGIRKRIIKSHSPYRKEYSNKKIIYLVRDPRDVFVSKFHKDSKRSKKILNKDKELSNFINGKMVSEGRWDFHVNSWLNAKKQDKVNMIIIRYKNLKMGPINILKRIANFLEINVTEKDIDKAIKDNEFNIMKKKNKDVRKGRVGSWREELTKNQSNNINKKFLKVMKKLNIS